MSSQESIRDLKERIGRSIIGQDAVVERLLLTLLCNGNLLLEGLPGLAKTRAIKSLAKNLESQFRRIQLRRIYCLPISQAQKSIMTKGARAVLYFSPALCSAT